MQNFYQDIKNVIDIDYRAHVSLKKYSTIRLEDYSDICFVSSLDSLNDLIRLVKKYNFRFTVLGWGANQILSHKAQHFYLKIQFKDRKREIIEEKFNSNEDFVDIPADLGLNTILSFAKKFHLKGYEVLSGIPASLGGAVAMNAGTKYGEIAQFVKEVKYFSFEKEMILTHIVNEESFKYRSNTFLKPMDIIVSVSLKNLGKDFEVSQKIDEYLTYRKQTQPIKSFNCGCVFKNYSPTLRAGACIDKIGLKGFSYRGLSISKLHANFIENQGDSSKEDFLQFLRYLKIRLYLYYGVWFEEEVKL